MLAEKRAKKKRNRAHTQQKWIQGRRQACASLVFTAKTSMNYVQMEEKKRNPPHISSKSTNKGHIGLPKTFRNRAFARSGKCPEFGPPPTGFLTGRDNTTTMISEQGERDGEISLKRPRTKAAVLIFFHSVLLSKRNFTSLIQLGIFPINEVDR